MASLSWPVWLVIYRDGLPSTNRALHRARCDDQTEALTVTENIYYKNPVYYTNDSTETHDVFHCSVPDTERNKYTVHMKSSTITAYY